MKTKLFLIVFILATYTMYGQDMNESKLNTHHYLGLGAGFTTGSGVSYRYLKYNYGFQVNFAPYYERDVSTFISFGGTFLYKLDEGVNHNLLLYYSNCVYYNKNTNTDYFGQKTIDKTSIWNTGIGANYEFNTTGTIVYNIMVGFGGYDSFRLINLTVEGAIYYKIK